TLFAAQEELNSGGILLDNCSNVTIRNCTSLLNTNGIKVVNSNNNTILNNTLNDNVYHGFWSHSSINCIIDDNSIYNNSNSGIALDSNSDANIITNNVISDHIFGVVLQISCILNNISQNEITKTNYGTYVLQSNNNTVSLNNYSDSRISGLHIDKSDYTFAYNNTFLRDVQGIDIRYSENSTIHDNKLNGTGFMMYGTVGECRSNSINTTNLVNNQPVFFYKDEVNLTALNFTGAGQVILVNCTNSSISGLTLDNHTCGILLLYCNMNNVTDNIINNMGKGIYLRESNNTILNRNNITNTTQGIFLQSINNASLSNNTLYYGGYLIDGTLQECQSHNIPTNNEINGKPFYYYKDESYLFNSNFSNAGQVYLVNCTNSSLQGLSLVNTTIGVSLMFCTNINVTRCNLSQNTYLGILPYTSIGCNISGNNISNNVYGMQCYYFDDNEISNNTFNGNYVGFYQLYSDNNTFLNNTFMNNSRDSIYSAFSNFGNLTDNDFFFNGHGIYMYKSDNFLIEGNNFTGNEETAIEMQTSKTNTIIKNEFLYNGKFGMYLNDNCSFNWIYINNFVNNSYSEAYIPLTFTGSNNNWHNGSMGNYWADYEERYPNATNTGIVWTTIYDVNGSTTQSDWYPLVRPYEDPAQPVADFYANSTQVLSRQFVGFTFNGTLGNTPNSFQWDFGDGSSNSTLKNPTHQYNSTGNFTVTLTVTDYDSESDMMVKNDFIEVTNTVPIASFTGNTTDILPNQYVEFTFDGFGGDNVTSFNWDFGDGSANSTQLDPIHQYTSLGNYSVVLTVTDGNGDADTFTKSNYIHVINNVPVVTFIVNQTVILENSSVTFSFTGYGGDSPYTASWTFGDGNISSIENPTHVYETEGNYTVSLTITDFNDDNDTLTRVGYVIVLTSNGDNDQDELLNWLEITIYGTNATMKDSDMDGMDDKWEIDNDLNPLLDDSTFDNDRDELTNLEEYMRGTYANDDDSDNDGLKDGLEISWGSDPLDKDSDNDGFDDNTEFQWRTDPTDPLSSPLYIIILLSSITVVAIIIISLVVKRSKKKPALPGDDLTSMQFDVGRSAELLEGSDQMERRLAEKRALLARVLEPREVPVSKPLKIEKKPKKKLKETTEEQAERIIDEKTEKEVTVSKTKEYCIVCNNQLKGTNFICPYCETKYCIRCAIALSERKENCWNCKQPMSFSE
ncbi:MAG: NosD domain-containing protein, partial [Candidatus Hodarchaeota archaeon]